MAKRSVLIIGAGMGGLAAAIDLSANGFTVTVLDRAEAPGGKARAVTVGGSAVDAGPTVFTMRWVFERLFEDAGADLAAFVRSAPLDVLARHAWRQGGALDLYADIDRSAEAIAAFAGSKEAEGYRAFCRDSAEIYDILLPTFICNQRPSVFELSRRIGLFGAGLWKLRPYSTLWSSLGRYFADPRLRQLFGRYATYCGSSPMHAPATLALVAHVERQGVWAIDGGMRALVQAMRKLAAARGVTFHHGCDVTGIAAKADRATGVRLRDGTVFEADAIVFSGDAQALNTALQVDAPRRVVAAYPPRDRSLSAVTWCIKGRVSGFPLDLHNVFFDTDYPGEFRAIFKRRTISDRPTVYICAQDRGPLATADAGGVERLLIIVNAPADGDRAPIAADDRRALQRRIVDFLSQCGLEIAFDDDNIAMTTPSEFELLFPATGGALYGRATHGPFASFARPGAATPLAGLYLAGGSVHPGPGVPMSAISGRLAAARLMADAKG